MTEHRALYDSLDLDPAASPDEIQAAYRRKAKAAHPDAGGSPEAFDRLSRAVAILKDPAARKRYDETGDTEPKVNNIEAEALQAVASVLQMLVDRDTDWTRFDIVEAMGLHLDAKVAEFKAAKAETIKKAVRYEAIAKRASSKRGKPNHVRNMLTAQAGVLRQQAASYEHNITVAKRARKLAASHTYEVDTSPQAYAPQQMNIRPPGFFAFSTGATTNR